MAGGWDSGSGTSADPYIYETTEVDDADTDLICNIGDYIRISPKLLYSIIYIGLQGPTVFGGSNIYSNRIKTSDGDTYVYYVPTQKITAIGKFKNKKISDRGNLYTHYINLSVNNPTVPVNISGTWKDSTPYVNVDGTWKAVSAAYVNVDGTWKGL